LYLFFFFFFFLLLERRNVFWGMEERKETQDRPTPYNTGVIWVGEEDEGL
jgi:hypothetical protein